MQNNPNMQSTLFMANIEEVSGCQRSAFKLGKFDERNGLTWSSKTGHPS